MGIRVFGWLWRLADRRRLAALRELGDRIVGQLGGETEPAQRRCGRRSPLGGSGARIELMAGAAWLRRGAGSGRAGSRRDHPGWRCSTGRRARLAPALERLDDDHAPAAARTGRACVGRFHRLQGCRLLRRDRQQLAGAGDAGLASGTGEQAIMPDAVEPARQNVEQEAADELVGGERHDALAVGPVTAIILVAESDAGSRRRRGAAGSRWRPDGCSGRDRRASLAVRRRAAV